jgi:hypothetical protein
VSAFALALPLFLTACGGAPSVAPVEPARPKPRDAAAIAQALAAGKTSILFYAERARSHPLTPKVLSLDMFRSVLEGTGIDPSADLARVFVTAADLEHGGDEIAVLEHTVEEARLKTAIEVLMGKSTPTGTWLTGTSVPEARVTIRGHTRVLAIATPTILLVLPEARALDAARFAGTGGLPDPTGDETAIAAAIDPSKTLRVPNAPRVPPSLRSAEGRVVLRVNGGASVDVDAASSSPEQAQDDAATLTEAVDRATSVKFAFLTVRVFRPIPFHADGDHVKAHLDLAPNELDTLLGLAAALAPR